MRRPDRLARLAEAQGSMARAVEIKLAAAERAIALLLAARAEIESLAAAPAAAHMALLPPALRKLVDLDKRLASARAEADALRRQLIAARGREKAFGKLEKQLRDSLARKAAEEEALETALGMAAKASGKADVVS